MDEVAILLICAVLLSWQWGDAFAAVGCAAAICLVCLCHILKAPGSVVAQCVFYIGAAFLSSFTLYLPVAVYAAMHERSWVVRFLWVVPLAIAFSFGLLSLMASISLAITCFIAVVLAIRDVRLCSERDGFRFAYDELRERSIALRHERDEAIARCEGEAAVQDHEADMFSDLTKRELAVVRLVAQGMDNREIAATLFLSEGTVRNHISAILAKKQLANRTQIAVAYYRGA